MIKDILNSNEAIGLTQKELSALKETFPACFGSDGSFDIARFKEYLSDKINVTNEGYELRFLGKNYARLLASLDTTTVIVPDQEHNNKPENKDSQNIYISGDNLDALKHLLKSYSGEVDFIYIDPPYNTGSDGFVYNDNFNFTIDDLTSKLSIGEEQAQRILDLTKRGSASHSAWLMYMYPRIVLARDLLSEDGMIMISIDENEQSNLELICNDIFGEENHLVTMTRRTKNGGGSASDAFAIENDYICVYGNNASQKLFMPFSEEYLKRYSEEDEIGRFFWDTMERSSTKTKPYKIIAPDGSVLTGKWFRGERRFKSDLESGEVRFLKKSDGTWSVQFKQRLAKGKKMRSILGEKEFVSSSDDLDELGLSGVFSYPKTVFLIKYLLQLVRDGATVVDFFSGSATTAHAVMSENTNRISEGKKPLNYIMVQIPQDLDQTEREATGDSKTVAQNAIRLLDSVHRAHTLDQIGIERIIRAAKKIKEETSLFNSDLGFLHYTLKEPSTTILSKIEEFNPKVDSLFKDTILNEFGILTVLTTWLISDGYGFTSQVESIDFNGYTGYYIEKHLYLINPGLKNETIASITEKIESEGSFNPENVVLFGYSFLWTEIEALKNNLARLRDSEKNLQINFDLRY